MNQGRLMRIARAVFADPWLIRPEMHKVMSDVVRDHMTGKAHVEGGRAESKLFEIPPPPDVLRMHEDIAIISISGVMGKRVSAIEKACGVADMEEIGETVEMAAADKEVRAIILEMDTPGGQVVGTPELAAQVNRATDKKSVIAYVPIMAASAGYWVASQADAIIAQPSAVVGSIGVYMAILDQSRAAENAGLSVEVFKAGKFKGAGIPGTSLTDLQREKFQGDVDYLHGQFKQAVRAGRGIDIPDELMEGQDFFGAVAQANGRKLVDECGDLGAAIEYARKTKGMKR